MLAGDFDIAPLIKSIRFQERLRFTVSHTDVEIIYVEHLRGAGDWIDAIRLKNPDVTQVFTYRS